MRVCVTDLESASEGYRLVRVSVTDLESTSAG